MTSLTQLVINAFDSSAAPEFFFQNVTPQEFLSANQLEGEYTIEQAEEAFSAAREEIDARE